jgi:hypothetical protein
MTTLHPFVGLHHPAQRRRREKKLLKIEEVNERFPVMTYKAWRAQRERAGLSAEGGVAPQTGVGANGRPFIDNTPPETPTDAVSPLPPQSSSPVLNRTEPYIDTTIEPAPKTAVSVESISEKSAVATSIDPISENNATSDHLRPVIATSSKHRDSSFSVDAEDEDDPSPVPNELLATSGDNCAICIELLEDDDEVRGLTCGHCYHQTCIDPWLTQRRASCPLCKADYYVPKPPPENTAAATDNATTPAANPPVTTEYWAPLFFRPFRPVQNPNGGPAYPPPFTRFDTRATIPEEPAENTPTTTTETTASTSNQPRSRRWGFGRVHGHSPFRRMTRSRNGRTTDANALERGEGGHRTEG